MSCGIGSRLPWLSCSLGWGVCGSPLGVCFPRQPGLQRELNQPFHSSPWTSLWSTAYPHWASKAPGHFHLIFPTDFVADIIFNFRPSSGQLPFCGHTSVFHWQPHSGSTVIISGQGGRRRCKKSANYHSLISDPKLQFFRRRCFSMCCLPLVILRAL